MIIGLTGSIASGKSTVARLLQQYGLPIVDADVVARQVVEPGSETLSAIASIFGQEILLEDGSMNRQKVGEIIFHNEGKRKQLNAVIHPAIRQEMLRQRDDHIANGVQTVIMDIPLLFESKLEHFVERILVVSVSEEIQLQRLMDRNQLTREEALVRIQSQIPIAKKEQLADAVVNNNGTIAATEAQLQKILHDWGISFDKENEHK